MSTKLPLGQSLRRGSIEIKSFGCNQWRGHGVGPSRPSQALQCRKLLGICLRAEMVHHCRIDNSPSYGGDMGSCELVRIELCQHVEGGLRQRVAAPDLIAEHRRTG